MQPIDVQPTDLSFVVNAPLVAGKTFPVVDALQAPAGAVILSYVEDNMSFVSTGGQVTIDSVSGQSFALTLSANMRGQTFGSLGSVPGTFLVTGHCTGTR